MKLRYNGQSRICLHEVGVAVAEKGLGIIVFHSTTIKEMTMFDILLQPLAGVLPVQHEDVTIATAHDFLEEVGCELGSDSTQSIGVIDSPSGPPNKIGATEPLPTPQPPAK